jgi:hypothetical protein
MVPAVKTTLPMRVVAFLPNIAFRNPLTSEKTIADAIVTLTIISCENESNENSSFK